MLKLICDLCGREETSNDWERISTWWKRLRIGEPNRCGACDKKWSIMQDELHKSTEAYRQHLVEELMVKYF